MVFEIEVDSRQLHVCLQGSNPRQGESGGGAEARRQEVGNGGVNKIMEYKKINLILLLAVVFFNTGCSHRQLSVNKTRVIANSSAPYHIVQKGETLWRISKNYGVPLEELARLSGIDDVSKIKVGQKIILPSSKGDSVSGIIGTASIPYSGPTENSFLWPVKGSIASFFGTTYDGLVNKGIDIKAGPGASVVSPKTGKIMFFCEDKMGYDNVIMLDHGDNYVSVIAGPGRFLGHVGDIVKQGDVVLSLKGVSNPVVHFEIRHYTKPVNPLRYLSRK